MLKLVTIIFEKQGILRVSWNYLAIG